MVCRTDLENGHRWLCEQLGVPADRYPLRFIPEHDGWVHVEPRSDGTCSLVVTERGEELSREDTGSLTDVLYFYGRAILAAEGGHHAALHGDPAADQRRESFAFQLQAMARLCPQWRDRLAGEFDMVLAEHPFLNSPEPKPRTWLGVLIVGALVLLWAAAHWPLWSQWELQNALSARGVPTEARIAGLTERMSELSRTLLGFARKPGTEITDVRLSAVVDEALLLAGPRAKKAGIVIRRSGIDPGLKVRGGRVRLTQVVVNLVNNAIDALTGIGAKGPTADTAIAISAAEASGAVRLVIEDNGPGLPSAEHDAVFEPFYSTKGVGEGIGIGLSIVYTIVKDLGGRIETGERAGGGARFTVVLQAAQGGDEAMAQPREEAGA